MTGLVAYYALVIVIPALVLGHQGQDFPPLHWWRARQDRRDKQPAVVPPAPARRPRPVPSWAHTEPYDYERAA